MVVTGVFVGCVIPPPLHTEAGNTPPEVMFEGTIPPPEPAVPWKVERTRPGQRPAVWVVTIRFRDPDPEPVWLRMFINSDYETFLDEVDNGVGPTSSGIRLAQFDVEGLCDGLLNEATPDVEVYLADTPFVNQGEDLRVTTVVDGRKGSRTSARWRIECIDADGG